jgi:8-oxo-dGTP diphosphatase
MTTRAADLRLRPLRAADAMQITASLADGRVAQTTATIPENYSIDDAHDWLRSVVDADRARRGMHEMGIEVDGELVGIVALQSVGDRRANISYWVSPTCWGQGVATYAVVEMVRRARDLGFTSVVGRCLVSNVRSARVLEKAGFERVANSKGPWRGNQVREFSDFVIRDLENHGS